MTQRLVENTLHTLAHFRLYRLRSNLVKSIAAKHKRRFDYGIYPHPKWDFTLDAKEVNKRMNCFPTSSYNIGTNGREDCLNLNLFIPGSLQRVLDENRKLPVLVYLHGGDYSYGSADGGGTFGKRTIYKL